MFFLIFRPEIETRSSEETTKPNQQAPSLLPTRMSEDSDPKDNVIAYNEKHVAPNFKRRELIFDR
jgi:hypothetical protein